MEQAQVQEIKSFLADQIKASNEETKAQLEGKLADAQKTIGDLRADLEAVKAAPPPSPRIEVQENKLDKWAQYYKNLFYAVSPHSQVILRNLDGGERTMTISPAQRVKAFETLERICDTSVNKVAWSEGVNTAGGYVIPTPQDLLGEILRIAQPASVALQECNVIPMRSMTLPLTSETTGVSVAWVNEASTITESEPVTGRFTLTAKKLAAYSKISNELLADADASVVTYLNNIFGEAIGQEIDKQVFRGGSATANPFLGVLHRTGVQEVTMGTGTLANTFSDMTPTHLSTMISKLSDLYTAGAKFYMHRTVEAYVREFKNSSGDFIYWPYQALGNGGGPSGGEIFGYPVKRVEQMRSTSLTDINRSFVAFGNLKNYWIGKRQEMSFMLDPYGLFLTDQIRLRVVSRWALGLPLASTFVRLKT